MIQSFVLEVPEIGYLLKQESVLQWKAYGPSRSGGYEKISWSIESSKSKVIMKSIETLGGTRKSAEIDFSANQITIHKGKMSDGEFTAFLQFLLEKAVLSTSEREMNFVITAKKAHEKVAGIRG